MQITIEISEEMYLKMKLSCFNSDELIKAVRKAIDNDGISLEEVEKRINALKAESEDKE